MPQKVLKGKEVVIFIDRREVEDFLLGKLRAKGVSLKPTQLKVGDFILSERVGVERKRTRDFIKSIIDGRLFKQASLLIENFKKPILIIEGEELFDLPGIHPNALRGVIISLVLDFGISIIWTRDKEETAELLFHIAKREQVEQKREVLLKGKRKPLGLKQMQEYIAASLPGVGIKIARSLLRHFKSVEGVFIASEKELRKVEHIGRKKAREIRRVLSSEY
jgi:Fanconi anemia group M protein